MSNWSINIAQTTCKTKSKLANLLSRTVSVTLHNLCQKEIKNKQKAKEVKEVESQCSMLVKYRKSRNFN